MDRDMKERIGVPDLLPYLDGVPLLDKRFARCTDVLRHGNPYDLRDRHHFRRTAGRIFVMAGCNAVQMLSTKKHCDSPFSYLQVTMHYINLYAFYENLLVLVTIFFRMLCCEETVANNYES